MKFEKIMQKLRLSHFFPLFCLGIGIFQTCSAYGAAIGSSVPLNTSVVVRPQSEWIWTAASQTLSFAGEGVSLRFLLQKKDGMPVVQGVFYLQEKYFNCDGAPLKLWFDNGHLVLTKPAACQSFTNEKGENSLWIRAENDLGDPASAKKLVRLLKHHHLIGISQPKKIAMLYYKDLTPLKDFATQLSAP